MNAKEIQFKRIFFILCHYNGAFSLSPLSSLSSSYSIHTPYVAFIVAHCTYTVCAQMWAAIIWFVLYSWNLIQLDLSRKWSYMTTTTIIIVMILLLFILFKWIQWVKQGFIIVCVCVFVWISIEHLSPCDSNSNERMNESVKQLDSHTCYFDASIRNASNNDKCDGIKKIHLIHSILVNKHNIVYAERNEFQLFKLFKNSNKYDQM